MFRLDSLSPFLAYHIRVYLQSRLPFLRYRSALCPERPQLKQNIQGEFSSILQRCYGHTVLAWVSGLPKGIGERIFLMGRGEGEKRKEGLTQNHSANRVTHPESGCGSDWITHNTPWRHRPQVNTSRVFWFHVLILWIETQRGIQRDSRGRSQVLSGNKNEMRERIVFSKPRS